MSAVSVSGLRVELAGSGIPVVDGVSFDLSAGEVVGLVGESGCGKSTVSMALMGYVRRGLEITDGRIAIDSGEDILAMSERDRRRLRGKTVAYVPQDPATALNPSMKLGQQLLEGLRVHGIGNSTRERLESVRERLAEVDLPSTNEFLDRFPHQISGGQQQRVSIAVAFSCLPKVLLCDEPTTGLDVSTQERVLQTIRKLAVDHDVATLYVSHDLAVVSELSDRVMVMYAGRVVESASVHNIFAAPRHPYTRALRSAMPSLGRGSSLMAIPGMALRPRERGQGCSFAPRCSRSDDTCRAVIPVLEPLGENGGAVACFHPELDHDPVSANTGSDESRTVLTPCTAVLEALSLQVRYGTKTVVAGVSLSVPKGQCLAVVGESGSGKTTLSRSLAGLVAPAEGTVKVHGEPVAPWARDRTALQRQRLQMVFQNPYASLNPRRTVGDSVGAPARHLFGASRGEARERAGEALQSVSLSSKLVHAYPDQLSGGERQRAAIARALICDPDVLICDEVTSALDVSIQASIINLLLKLKDERGLGLLFVTHNLPLVNSLAEFTMVLKGGVVVEHGPTSDVLNAPKNAYTQALLRDNSEDGTFRGSDGNRLTDPLPAAASDPTGATHRAMPS